MKGRQNDYGEVASPESVPIHVYKSLNFNRKYCVFILIFFVAMMGKSTLCKFNPTALRKVFLSAIGLNLWICFTGSNGCSYLFVFSSSIMEKFTKFYQTS